MSDVSTIVKVQTAVAATADGIPLGLVYAEGRKRVRQMPLPADVLDALGDDRKGYFRATWTGAAWVIRERVEDQTW
jgi:hypothetical protein